MADEQAVEVRIATPEDRKLAKAAERLIEGAVEGADIARRSKKLLRKKIESGRAAVALHDGELVGFGYFSKWQDGQFVSHSGLVVREDFQGRGLGRLLKERLFEASRKQFPDARIMSLTTSKAVESLNLSLGFRHVPLSELTTDPEFWKGCETCRNFEEVCKQGEQCCCFAMLLDPPES